MLLDIVEKLVEVKGVLIILDTVEGLLFIIEELLETLSVLLETIVTLGGLLDGLITVVVIPVGGAWEAAEELEGLTIVVL